MLSFRRIANKPRLIRNFTGLAERQFIELVSTFDKADKNESQSRSKARQRLTGAGRKPVLSTIEDRLLFILFYFRFYPTQEVLGFFFSLSQGQANHWVHRLTPVVNAALGYKMQLPERKPANIEKILSECPDLQFIIDGTERPIVRPKDRARQKKYYSGKKKRHTVKNLVVSEKKSKRIKVLSPTYEGKKHDKAIASEQEISFPPGSILYQDTGFQGYQPPGILTIQPKKKPRKRELTDREKRTNRAISRQRIRVEHSIGGVKIYRIVKDIYRNHKPDYEDLVFETTIGLYNFRIAKRIAA